MSVEQLEQRVAALEAEVAKLRGDAAGKVDVTRPNTNWLEKFNKPMTPEESHAFWEMTEYGKYYRATMQDPPPDWKPGDPIPESNYDDQ